MRWVLVSLMSLCCSCSGGFVFSCNFEAMELPVYEEIHVHPECENLE